MPAGTGGDRVRARPGPQAQRRDHTQPPAGSQRTRRTGIEGAGGAGSGGQLGRASGADEAVSTATANARALRVRDFTLRYVDEDAGALSAGSDAWVGAVDTTWAFRGFDRTVARTEVSFTFRQDGDQASIVGIGGNERRTPLWLAGPVTVRRGPGVLVVAAGGAGSAARYFELASRAVTVVRRVEPAWRDGLVVEVPESADQLDEELDAEPGEYDNIAAVTTTVNGSVAARAPVHVFVNPEVFGPLKRRGAQVVMSHEATHVATGAATTSMPLWLVEGFADYVALRDVDLPLSVSAAQSPHRCGCTGLPRTCRRMPSSTQPGPTWARRTKRRGLPVAPWPSWAPRTSWWPSTTR